MATPEEIRKIARLIKEDIDGTAPGAGGTTPPLSADGGELSWYIYYINPADSSAVMSCDGDWGHTWDEGDEPTVMLAINDANNTFDAQITYGEKGGEYSLTDGMNKLSAEQIAELEQRLMAEVPEAAQAMQAGAEMLKDNRGVNYKTLGYGKF